jgi:polysaccharide deacetylase 2 family uncharacterized protein YibQ
MRQRALLERSLFFNILNRAVNLRLSRKKHNNKLTVREKLAAVLISGLCIPLFLAIIFAYRAINTTEMPPAAAKMPPSAAKQPPAAAKTPPAAAKQPPVAAKTVAAAGQPVERPRRNQKAAVVYVIDDAGNNLRELDPFLNFPGSLTIAVLPGLPYSVQAAQMVRGAGKELFLHQPMEALGGADPGPGAIYLDMNADEIRAVLKKNVAEIGPVAGLNNHQGSLITQNKTIMKVVLEFCRDNNILFLDSRTTADTAAPEAARETGFNIAERNIFLDNEQDKNAIAASLEQGLLVARQKKTAVMIGHTWSPELAGLLSEMYPALIAQGYTFLTVSEVMRENFTP